MPPSFSPSFPTAPARWRTRPPGRCLALALLLTLLTAAAPARGEDMPLDRMAFQTWSTEAGLPQISVHDIAYDGDGTLWLATESGLARFDGVHFRVFTSEDTPALATRWISRLFRDRAGRMWVASQRGLARWENGVFAAQTVAGGGLGQVTAIAEDDDGRLWTAGDGLFYRQNDVMVPVPGWQGGATTLLADGRRMWVAGGKGVLAEMTDGQWRRRVFPELGDAVVRRLVQADGKLWLATNRGLFVLADDRMAMVPLDDHPPSLSAMAIQADGTLWLGSDAALYRRSHDGAVDRLAPPSPGAFPGIISLLPSRDGGMWVGSQQQGLRHLWPDPVRALSTADGLRDPRVWSLLPTGNGVIVGHNAGYDLLVGEHFTPLVDGATLPEPTGYSALRDRRNRLWLGNRRGLVRLDSGKATVIAPLDGSQVNGMIEADDGTIWIASNGGLFRSRDDQLLKVEAADGLDENKIRYLLIDRRGVLWVGSAHGLFRGDGGRFSRIEAAGLGEVFVSAMTQLSDGRLVAGTDDGSLFLSDGADWRRLSRQQGFPRDSVFFLGEYGASLIVGNSNGAYRLPVASLAAADHLPVAVEMLLYDQGDHLGRSRVRCCNGAGNGRGVIRGDELLLPTLNGVARIPLDLPPAPAPSVRIDEIRSRGNGVAQAQNGQSAVLTLPRGARAVDITFSALDFLRGSQLEYRYRLEGIEPDWVANGPQTRAAYSHLPPGHWRFTVQARHLYEPWGPTTAIELTLPATFVEGWLFKLLLAALVVGAILLWVKLRENRLVKQKLALEALVAERTADLALTNSILAEASVTDSLTGLRNRRFLQDNLDFILGGLQRARHDGEGDIVLGVILIDIDHFKSVNDIYGHAVGDAVLRRVATALRTVGRDKDVVVRWGGEEFLVLLHEVGRADLAAAAERLRLAIAQAPGEIGEPRNLTASIGFVGFPLPAQSSDPTGWTLALAVADKALYGAKQAGRNRCATILFDSEVANLPQSAVLDWLPGWLASGRARIDVKPQSQ